VPDCHAPKSSDLDSCFDGIIAHIFRASGRTHNIGDIAFSYATICAAPDSHPTFVLDYTTQGRYGTAASMFGQFFGVRFARMTILPVAYALGSDHYTSGQTT
jgi:predicted benzoate:H+ symporter BenE